MKLLALNMSNNFSDCHCTSDEEKETEEEKEKEPIIIDARDFVGPLQDQEQQQQQQQTAPRRTIVWPFYSLPVARLSAPFYYLFK